ncbi:L-aspartate oxidase [Modicisalibacter ilicicola DSM 19980]|uniref:L-aspartate oxidase n=1 Tax=Modicisalibacter ilicicola DSM 19980 TaxID=1121942 RepID=A0A1M4ZDT0_9GAMM|nr:L-aspartate oxidase [Halomonas ilicicola]SHF16219.1 L-aspartate oxidase [Halomonas ilicicola DSM 19980]
MIRSDHDVLIIGGGVAGLSLALELADHRPVTLLRPAQDDLGASVWAQGGIAAVLAPQDDVEAHVQDTLVAGDGLCDEAAVRFTVENGRAAIDWLLGLGVPFTPDTTTDAPYPYHLTREGGHGARRIIHAADATGRALIETLLDHVRRHPAIQLIGDLQAIELLEDPRGDCRGALCLDATHRPHLVAAHDTVLATGGASGLYRHTTSPAPACGEGMAMAAELGATLMNLEFQQFHPTCLYDPSGTPFLISEAVRGEGGLLRDARGRRFMPDYDERAELAPRDIVARAIHAEILRDGGTHVLLDVTHLEPGRVREHFPTIHAHCLNRGLDINRQPIPVVPAAHYSCGGIATDLHGASDIGHLHAIGEVACTGLHGANRMASNSLLECLVFARAAASALRRRSSGRRGEPVEPSIAQAGVASQQSLARRLEELRDIMSLHAGIVRSDAGLASGRDALRHLREASEPLWKDHAPTPALARLRHALLLAGMLLDVASARRESRGLHHNLDCPTHGTGKATASRIRSGA